MTVYGMTEGAQVLVRDHARGEVHMKESDRRLCRESARNAIIGYQGRDAAAPSKKQRSHTTTLELLGTGKENGGLRTRMETFISSTQWRAR